jgi:hypothetical protein
MLPTGPATGGRGSADITLGADPGAAGITGLSDCGLGLGSAEGGLEAAAGMTRVFSSSLGSMPPGIPIMVFAAGFVPVAAGAALGSFSCVTAARHHTP